GPRYSEISLRCVPAISTTPMPIGPGLPVQAPSVYAMMGGFLRAPAGMAAAVYIALTALAKPPINPQFTTGEVRENKSFRQAGGARSSLCRAARLQGGWRAHRRDGRDPEGRDHPVLLESRSHARLENLVGRAGGAQRCLQ